MARAVVMGHRRKKRALLPTLVKLLFGVALVACMQFAVQEPAGEMIIANVAQPSAVMPQSEVGTVAAGGGAAGVALLHDLAPWHSLLSLVRWPYSAVHSWTMPSVESQRQMYRVDHGDFRPYRKWYQWLQESCFVMGFSVKDSTSSGEEACPDLWVDESWPRGTSASMQAAQLMSLAGKRVLVLQAKVVRQLPAEEVKAHMGQTLAMLFCTPLPLLPELYVAGRSVQWGLQHQHDWRALLTGGAASWKRAVVAATPPAPAPAPRVPKQKKQSQQQALSVRSALTARVPVLLQPLVKDVILGGKDQKLPAAPAAPQRPQRAAARKPRKKKQLPQLSLPTSFGGALPDLAAYLLLKVAAGGYSRAGTVIADRSAALACGDAETAAVSLLRTHGLLPRGSYDNHRQGALLQKVAGEAAENEWAWRMRAAATASHAIRVELRIKLLLDWAKSKDGKKYMDLAEQRRKRFRHERLTLTKILRQAPKRPTSSTPTSEVQQKVSPPPTLTPVREGKKKVPAEKWWRQRICQLLLAFLLLIPCARTVDAMRWATFCTLVTTVMGLLAPLTAPSSGGWPLAMLAAVVAALFLYVVIVLGSLWWNHLFGGSSRWSRLSALFARDVADQANATASIAYLTRHWAEMAKRSMEHLDEELCGSWRSSLHELATKLNDLQQELNACMPHRSIPLSPTAAKSVDDGSGPSGLWLKVDSAVKDAVHIECTRIQYANCLDDSESLRGVMTWWMVPKTDAASLMGAPETAPSSTDSLGELLLVDQLHQAYNYQPFHNKDAGGGIDLVEREAWPEANQFTKLEREISLNFHSLEELRSQVSMWQDARHALFWTIADFRRVCSDYQRAIWHVTLSGDHKVYMSFGDQQKSLLSMSCLLLAVFGGFGIAAASMVRGHLTWALGSLNFAAANAVLLLNYSKLRLPYVHRRFSQRLSQLQTNREKIITEMQAAQRASQSGGVNHLRACITWQSVNMLRNINYVASCVKSQVQRAAAEDRPWEQRRHVAMCGLQMLLTLLPRRQLLDKAENLAPDDCNLALAVLHDRRRGMTLGSLRSNVLLWREFSAMRKRVIDAQRNLWVLFRMVHFSSAIPSEEQGQLKALLDRFIRPVLVEGRVPLGIRPEVFEGMMGGAPGANGHATSRNSRRTRDPPDAPPRRTMEASRRGHSFCSESSFTTLSGKSTVDSEHNSLDAKKMLHRLAATRADIANVLSRLPPAALVDASLATCPPTGAIFTDVFSSIIVGLHSGHIPEDSSQSLRSNNSPLAQQHEPVGFAVGFSHGDQEYHLDGHIRTTLLLRVLYPKPKSGSRENIQEYDVQQFSVPLSAITAEEPSRQALEAAWVAVEGRLCLADGRLGESALKARRRSLRRAKDVLRSLGGRRAA